MDSIHDALEKAIKNAELESENEKIPVKNVYQDQVISTQASEDDAAFARAQKNRPAPGGQEASVFDRLDNAIQQSELEEPGLEKPPLQNIYQDRVASIQQASHNIDHNLMRQRRIVTLHSHDAESGAFRMLRTKILKQMRDNDWNSFAVTAPTQGAGKTTVSVNLAIAMAMDVNQSVLLVDLDLRYPKVHWYFGLENENGLRDYFLSNKPLSEIFVNPGIDRLTILPGRGQTIGSAEILSGPRMKMLMNDIQKRNQARIVIFDLPPVLATDDVLVTTEYYDAVLLVVEEGKSQPEDVKKTLKLLAGKKLLGTVLNKSQNPPEHQNY
jgi:protein-tyrosine kinase